MAIKNVAEGAGDSLHSSRSLTSTTLALRQQTAKLRQTLRSLASWRKDPEMRKALHGLLMREPVLNSVGRDMKHVADEQEVRFMAKELMVKEHHNYNLDAEIEMDISSTGTLNAELVRLRGERASVRLLRFALFLWANDIQAPVDCFTLARRLAGEQVIVPSDNTLAQTEGVLQEAATWLLIKTEQVETGWTKRPMLVSYDKAGVVTFISQQALVALAQHEGHHGNEQSSLALVPAGAPFNHQDRNVLQHREWALAVWHASLGQGAVMACARQPIIHRAGDITDHADDVKGEAIDSVLGFQSVGARQREARAKAIYELCTYTSVCQRVMSDQYRRPGVIEHFCEDTTRQECAAKRSSCTKLHFKINWLPQTDLNFGACSYSQGCFSMDKCKCVHYILDEESEKFPKRIQSILHKVDMTAEERHHLPAREFIKLPTFYQYPAQWINCDVRTFDYNILGKFGVVMADPPWAIHMDLPYGTMEDDEMKQMKIPVLQDDGFIFLWVTMRALELARDCLDLWGYRRIDELIWVKTNQLQQLMRIGRTGHYINHSKEHCLVGVKGNPKGFNPLLDTDVLVAELRATSRKPDEMYALVERFFPGTRKIGMGIQLYEMIDTPDPTSDVLIELFGRPHNTNPGWVTLGNQLESTRIYEPELKKRYNERYPELAIP